MLAIDSNNQNNFNHIFNIVYYNFFKIIYGKQRYYNRLPLFYTRHKYSIEID